MRLWESTALIWQALTLLLWERPWSRSGCSPAPGRSSRASALPQGQAVVFVGAALAAMLSRPLHLRRPVTRQRTHAGAGCLLLWERPRSRCLCRILLDRDSRASALLQECNAWCFCGVRCLDLAGLDLAFVGAIGLFTSIGLPIARGRAATGAGHAFVGAALAAMRRRCGLRQAGGPPTWP